jgi:alkanesulfonate monooxygenase
VTTASTADNEHYYVARNFATLDFTSGSRSGWNIVTSLSEAEAQTSTAKHRD